MAEEEDKPVVPAALAGAAVYQGTPLILAPLLSDVPHGLASMVTSGQPLEAEFGTPISRLAEFSRAEVNAIKDFAMSKGVTLPIVAAGPGLESGYMLDRPGPVRRLIAKLVDGADEIDDIVPHIGLSQSSVPHALHEIGHAAPIMGSQEVRRAFQSLGRTLGGGSTVGNMLRAMFAGNTFAPPDEDSSDARKFMYNNAPALVGATMVPELLEEGRATINALRGSRAAGVGVGRTLAELAPAFGTYLASAAAPVLATMLAKKVVAALRDNEEAKTAAPMPGQEVKAPGGLRASASSAWKIGVSPPKPKTIGPDARLGEQAKSRAPAKPPSKTSYYKDMLSSLYNPQRGSRLAVPG